MNGCKHSGGGGMSKMVDSINVCKHSHGGRMIEWSNQNLVVSIQVVLG